MAVLWFALAVEAAPPSVSQSTVSETSVGQAALDELVQSRAAYYNVSLSIAITLESGRTLTSAAGTDDRKAGTAVTTTSLYPGGSVTKTFTATAALKLQEAGKLDLDAPVHSLVDPWLQAHGLPSLLECWGGDPTINLVTTRHLLQMRSGIPDYDDSLLRQFTVDHPDDDFLPLGFIASVPKHFLFAPGKGGAYTGVGYVLVGWVIAAASGAASWDALDQRHLVEMNPPGGVAKRGFTFEHARFMGRGLCSQYIKPDRVVHQYLYQPGTLSNNTLRNARPQRAGRAPWAAAQHAAIPIAAGEHCTKHDPSNWYEGVHIGATELGQRHISDGGAESCCGLADQFSGATYWQFISSAGQPQAGTCTFYSGTAQLLGYWSNSTAGMVDVSVHECRNPASIEAGFVGWSRGWPEMSAWSGRGAQHRSWGFGRSRRPACRCRRGPCGCSNLLSRSVR